MAHQCTAPPVWLVPTGVYLITFLIGNLSYSPCSEPSRAVLFLDLMYTQCTPASRLNTFHPPGPLHINYFSMFSSTSYRLCIKLVEQYTLRD